MNLLDSFLQLIRLGIGHDADRIAGEIAWNDILALAERQGLSAILVDGVERLPESSRPPKPLLLQLIGVVMQGYEHRYGLCKRTLSEMAGFYNSTGFKMMVLKGFSCSLTWPKPEHRPCGDIDIWLFRRHQEADSLLGKEKGILVDNSHHHHTVFSWNGFMVENHFDFINVHHHRSNVALEKVFKELGEDDTHFVELNGEKVYIPSPNLHALFLLKHTMNDFTAHSMTFRQVLDWAFHVREYGKEIDWEWLVGVLEKYHMMFFFNTINAICVEDLGFDANLFPNIQFTPLLKEIVLQDIINPQYLAEEPAQLIPRIFYKFKRWRANGWKHELCYNESMLSALISGLWSHLLKPKTIWM